MAHPSVYISTQRRSTLPILLYSLSTVHMMQAVNNFLDQLIFKTFKIFKNASRQTVKILVGGGGAGSGCI